MARAFSELFLILVATTPTTALHENSQPFRLAFFVAAPMRLEHLTFCIAKVVEKSRSAVQKRMRVVFQVEERNEM